MNLETRPLDAFSPTDVEALLARSRSWFWQTNAWRHYTKLHAGERLVADASLGIGNGDTLLAACPLLVESTSAGPALAFSGGPCPQPAVDGSLSRPRRAEVEAACVDATRSVATEHGVGMYSFQQTPLASRIGNGHHAATWLRHGLVPVPAYSQVMDLERDLDALWGDVRKGHRAAIRRAGKHLKLRVVDSKHFQPEAIETYRLMHAKDAGRVTRPVETFEAMGDWVRTGDALLVVAEQEGLPAACALVIAKGHGAYYASACRDPDVDAPGAHHLIQWNLVEQLRARGVRRYELGQQHIGPAFHGEPTEKDRSIAAFKRGFGGVTVSAAHLEWYRDYEAARNRWMGLTEIVALQASA